MAGIASLSGLSRLVPHRLSWLARYASYGQPHPFTHPHLFQSTDELNPGITSSEFTARRERLCERIRSHGKDTDPTNHIVIVPSSKKSYMVEKIPYFFRQDTDFRYLTGCLQPDCVLVLEVDRNGAEKSVLFTRKADRKEVCWEGARTSPEDCSDVFGVDKGLDLSNFERYLSEFKRSHSEFVCWYDIYTKNKLIPDGVHDTMLGFMRYSSSKLSLESPKRLIHDQRVIKSPAEIALMRKSCQIAAESMRETMARSIHTNTEQEAFATVDYLCRLKGAEFLAYPPVVAAGNNATIIHYINNIQKLSRGDILLMDAGCEYHGYASDITRTWPTLGGRFNSAQSLLYEIVLQTQQELLDLLSTNLEELTVDRLYSNMQTILLRHLEHEGLVDAELSTAIKYNMLSGVCPHHVSHYLGMDVHDTNSVPRTVPLQPGMVITLEPGLYINRASKDYPEDFRGNGIRIEDDVLIDENGRIEVLSAACPKSKSEVEELCRISLAPNRL